MSPWYRIFLIKRARKTNLKTHYWKIIAQVWRKRRFQVYVIVMRREAGGAWPSGLIKLLAAYYSGTKLRTSAHYLAQEFYYRVL